MARSRPPLWLSAPSVFAGWPRDRARLMLAGLATVLLLCLTALAAAGPPPVSQDPARHAEDRADVDLYESIVAGVRGGGDYYRVTARALRDGNYPLKPFVTFRLPTLAVLQARLPDAIVLLLQFVLAATVGLAWFARLRPAFQRPPPLAVAMTLLAGGMMAFVQASLAPFHEIWAGMLVAIALALRRPGQWIEAAAIGMMAMLIRETAALFVLAMAATALIEGHRREAAGWAVTLVLFGGVVIAHAHAVAQVVGPVDPVSPGWAGMLGFGFFVKTMTLSSALRLLPLVIAAPLVGLTLFGWSAWPGPIARRALVVFAAYGLLLALFGRADTFYWGLMIAPAFLIGLAFVPDGLRDLWVAAFERRRITVTRMVK